MKKIKLWKKSKEPKRQQKASAAEAFKKFLRVLPLIIIIIGLSFLVKELTLFLYTSPYFYVGSSEVYIDKQPASEANARVYGPDINKNIFKVGLRSLKDSVRKGRPEIKKIHVSRRFPNKIIIDIDIREAVVQVRAGKYYPVDIEGIVLLDIRDEPSPRLPVLAGAQGKTGSLKVGAKINTPNYEEAKGLLRAIIKTQAIKGHRFLYIDCYDYKSLSIFIDDGLELKMGRDNYEEKLGMLADVFDRVKNDVSDIKYIDLRFKDVIIAPKTGKR